MEGGRAALAFLLIGNAELNYRGVLASAWPQRASLLVCPVQLPITHPALTLYDLLRALCFDCLQIFIVPRLPRFTMRCGLGRQNVQALI